MRQYTIPLHPSLPLAHPSFAPRVASSFHTCSTCTRHLNIRASPAHSGPSPLLCVNCIIFTPNTVRSPVCRAPRPPRSTGQIAHVHRKSPPGTVSQPHVALPAATTLKSATLPYLRRSSLFSESHVYLHLALRRFSLCDLERDSRPDSRDSSEKSEILLRSRFFERPGRKRRRKDEVWRT